MTHWTDEQDALLRACIAEGLTSSQSMRRINGTFKTERSRNGTIGRANRLGLNFSGTDLPKVAAERHAENIAIMRKVGGQHAAATRRRNGTPTAGRPRARPDPTTLPELEPLGPVNAFPDDSAAVPSLCRAITGDPILGDWSCCGRPVVGNGRPYCDNHQAKFYNPNSGAGKAPHWLISRGLLQKVFG